MMSSDHKSTSLPNFLYGTAWKEAQTASLVELALAAGFRGIDTANQRKHYFEEAVGQGIHAAIAKGMVSRDELFIQTKYTFQRGQDVRLPYDPEADIETQVAQSFENSLSHLQVDYIDALILHGPYTAQGLTEYDRSAWQAMEKIKLSGDVNYIGLSNVSLAQLKAFYEMAMVKPTFVQNRCFANTNWDQAVREYCVEHAITYQGFSLLTANLPYIQTSKVVDIAHRYRRAIPPIIFKFAMQIGMLPLTGTSSAEHMSADLAIHDFELSQDELVIIERIAETF